MIMKNNELVSLDQQPKQEMVRMGKKFKQKLFGAMIFISPVSLMAATDFKVAFGKIMGFGAIVAFVLCGFFIYEGIMHWRQGGSFGKDIIGVVITAGSIAICGYIFTAFGMADAIIDPTF